mmetsp:Transcript_21581/g.51518  ORF Transcript_21581/g.51518 Transcript_21581/m.51518 type:complete len:538 (-) Transcript_21581:220-1833(-)
MEDDIKQLSSSLKDSLQVTNVKAGTKQGEMPTSVQTLSNAVSSSSDPAQTPSTPSSVGTSTSTQPWLLGTASSPLSVWATSAVNNLSDGPQRNAWDDALNTGTNVRLLVARGERASFQVGVSSQGSVRGLEVAITCSRFNADRSSKSCAIPGTGLNPSCVSLRRIYPPDALVPCAWGARLSMPEEGTVGFWVSIDVPTSQDPGLYQGDLTVAGHVSLLPAKAAVPALRSVADKCSRATSADGPVDLYKALKSVEDEIRRISSQLDHGSRMLLPEVLSVSLEVVDVQIPQCPSFPVLCGLSEEVLENRWQVERNSEEWRTLLCRHFRFMLRYRMCPYFCRWGARGCGMGLVTYTSPFPIGSPMADELLSSPQLCRYVVPFPSDENGAAPLEAEDATAPTHASLKHAQAQPHWAKAMFYLFDEPTTTAEYEKLDLWASRLRETVPKPTVLTTFYCGPKDGTFPEGSWQSLMEVPELLKDSTQVFCVSQWALGEDPSAPRELADTIMHAVGDSGEQWSYVCMVWPAAANSPLCVCPAPRG